MILPILDAGLNLAGALALGAAIGLERQWRQRLAGLRTNTLVSLGAASYILFSRLAFGDAASAAVGAQVVSGIGFLRAGVIFKEGLNVRGLNTAATLWCSAAVGLLAGSGFPAYGVLCASLVICANLVLRPIVRAINRQPVDTSEGEVTTVITVVCRGPDEAQVRSLLLQGVMTTPDLHFTELDSTNIEDTDRVEITATMTSFKRPEIALEAIVGRLSLETGVTRARWRSQTPTV